MNWRFLINLADMPVYRYARVSGTEVTMFVTHELHGHYITEDGELYWPDELYFLS